MDKADRIKLFQLCTVGMSLHHLGFYFYARHVAPGGVPPVGALVGFSIFYTAMSNLGTIASAAMLSDYIATSQMGTISAAIGSTRTIFLLLTGNAIGCWVSIYSFHFGAGVNGGNDYLSGYHYLIPTSFAATAAAIWFGREARSGRLIPYGLIEQQQRLAPSGGTEPMSA